jgi:hypothetical protein
MGGNARWTAVAIRMDGTGKIKMDGGSGDGQQRCNGRRNGETNAMGKAAAMGGNVRWMAAVIMMDGGSEIAIDGGSGN